MKLIICAVVLLSWGWIQPGDAGLGACSPLKPGPFCTNVLSQVTPTLPRCVVPISQYGNCRSIAGMPPVPPGGSIIPSWFNYTLARRGQKVTSEYRFSWYTNMFNGLLVEMNMPDVLYPLLFNKKNTNPLAAAKRDLATIMQGMVWNKDYLWKMPQVGGNWVTSIQSVRNTHHDVQTRGNAALAGPMKCIINSTEYETYATNDAVWDAFEKDMDASSLLTGPGARDFPTSTWLTCPDTTTCGTCGNRCSSNCVDICAENPNFFPALPFPPGAISNITLSNVSILNATLADGTVFDGVFDSVAFNGGVWTLGSSGGNFYHVGDMWGGNITSGTIVKGRYANRTKIVGGTLVNTVFANGTLLYGGILDGVTVCTVLYTNCSTCAACQPCEWTPPTCFYSDPDTFDCANCLCDENGLNCGNCTTCNNNYKCLPFPIPLYNQQAMGFVVYNLVGFVILWPAQIGINPSCQSDLWAFVHLWSGILSALGVEDQCNVLLQPDIATAKVYFQQIFDIYVLPTLFKFDKKTRFMMDNVFKGLGVLTLKSFTPELLLCKFVRDFLHVPNPTVCNLRTPADILFDAGLTQALPAFQQSSLFRSLVNTGLDDLFYFQAQVLQPGSFPTSCLNYTSISTSCLV